MNGIRFVSFVNTYTLEQLLLVIVGAGINATFVFGGDLDLWLFGLTKFKLFKFAWIPFRALITLTGYLPVRASGSKPFFKALCLSCCFCLSFNSLSWKRRNDRCFENYSSLFAMRYANTNIVVLTLLPFLQIVLLCFQLDNGLPQLGGLGAQSIGSQVIDFQGLDAEGERDLLLFLQLFLSLVTLHLGTGHTELLD